MTMRGEGGLQGWAMCIYIYIIYIIYISIISIIYIIYCIYIYYILYYIYVSRYLDILCALYIYICPICPLDLDKSWYMIYHIDTETGFNRLNLPNDSPLPLPQKLLESKGMKLWDLMRLLELFRRIWGHSAANWNIGIGSAEKESPATIPPVTIPGHVQGLSKNVRYAVCMAT